MRGVFRSSSRIHLHGVERVPRHGPLIVVSNHAQWVDPVMLGAFFPRPVIFMAKHELWRRGWVAWIVERFGAFPVRRGEADREAIRQALGILEADGALGIFPEGTRSRDGILREPHPGVGLLALRSDAPLLPVGVAGTVPMDGTTWLGTWPRVDITFGEPFRLSAGVGAGRGRLAAATDEIMRQVAVLLPSAMRGPYGEGA
jgi:1-acyl-sn-glycerol-3-phosphate acyltransferase